MQDNAKQSNFLDVHVAELTPSHEQLAYISGDGYDESNSELIPAVTSPNLEETVVTSLPGSSDVLSTLEETEGGTSTFQYEARTLCRDQIYPKMGFHPRRYPSHSHRPPLDLMTMFDSSMRVMLQRRRWCNLIISYMT